MSDERGYDTKGSRKALGAMNAKLKAKIGRLERELATYHRLGRTEMSKELIEKLRAFAPYASPNAADLMHEAADALESRAAPVGEREAFDQWYRNTKGLSDTANTTFIDGSFFPYKAFLAGAAYQRAQQPQSEETV